jgi:hypothetical protein
MFFLLGGGEAGLVLARIGVLGSVATMEFEAMLD